MDGHTVDGVSIRYDDADAHMFALTAGYTF